MKNQSIISQAKEQFNLSHWTAKGNARLRIQLCHKMSLFQYLFIGLKGGKKRNKKVSIKMIVDGLTIYDQEFYVERRTNRLVCLIGGIFFTKKKLVGYNPGDLPAEKSFDLIITSKNTICTIFMPDAVDLKEKMPLLAESMTHIPERF